MSIRMDRPQDVPFELRGGADPHLVRELSILTLKIELTEGYPSHETPKLAITGFYQRYLVELTSKLNEKWSPNSFVLYEWYSYCVTDFFSEIISPARENDSYVLHLTSEEIETFKEEEYRAIKFMLETNPTLCDICYMEKEIAEEFLILNKCLHFFCLKCLH